MLARSYHRASHPVGKDASVDVALGIRVGAEPLSDRRLFRSVPRAAEPDSVLRLLGVCRLADDGHPRHHPRASRHLASWVLAAARYRARLRAPSLLAPRLL